MASSVRRPARVCGSLLSQELRTARVCGDPPREFSSAGREYSKLLSSARAHCWQGFDAHVGRRSPNLCEFLMYHDSDQISWSRRAAGARLCQLQPCAPAKCMLVPHTASFSAPPTLLAP